MMRRPERRLRFRRMRGALRVVAAATVALTVGACGESAQDQAQTTICDGRVNIQTEIGKLTSYTPSTVSRQGVVESVDTIKGNLAEMADAQKELSGDRRAQ